MQTDFVDLCVGCFFDPSFLDSIFQFLFLRAYSNYCKPLQDLEMK